LGKNYQATLLLMPKGLDVEKLMELFDQEEEVIKNVERLLNRIRYTKKVSQTYRILITHEVIEGTENLSTTKQEKRLKDQSWRSFGLPNMKEAITLILITQKQSQQNLYSNTYTRCRDYYDGSSWEDEQIFIGNDDNRIICGAHLQDPKSWFFKGDFYEGHAIGAGAVCRVY